jgi:hypothetical protein
MSQLAYLYLANFQLSLLSLMVTVVGYGLAASAAMALGVDRTYFGVELGKKMSSTTPHSLCPGHFWPLA